jgi:hypothetical protein
VEVWVFIRSWLLGFGTVAVSTGLLAACGSSGGPAKASSQDVHKTCLEVSAVLSDGPDSGADPVGYALAQILPLRQIKKTSDQPLQQAIDHLDAAYKEFYDDKGIGRAAKDAVNQATDQINALCPGAAS